MIRRDTGTMRPIASNCRCSRDFSSVIAHPRPVEDRTGGCQTSFEQRQVIGGAVSLSFGSSESKGLKKDTRAGRAGAVGAGVRDGLRRGAGHQLQPGAVRQHLARLRAAAAKRRSCAATARTRRTPIKDAVTADGAAVVPKGPTAPNRVGPFGLSTFLSWWPVLDR